MMEEFNNWDEIAENFADACAEVVEQTADDGAFNVEQQITDNGQVVTGLMRGSVYINTYDHSTYGAFTGKYDEKYLLDQVELPEDRYSAYFAVAASYAWFPNYGTRFQAANPFWEPAIDKTWEDFERHLSEIEANLR